MDGGDESGQHRAILLGHLEGPAGGGGVDVSGHLEPQHHADKTPRRHFFLHRANRHLQGTETLAFLAENLDHVVGEARRQ